MSADLTECENFSLVLGGPLFQLLRRARLTDDALRMVHKRILAFVLLAWLPLLVLSSLGGQMLGGSAAVPFLRDIDVHIRFLVAMPLLLIAEFVVHQRIRPLVHQFVMRHLIPAAATARFNAAVASSIRLRNSVLAEILLMTIVYIVGILILWRHHLALETATWYATPSREGVKLSVAGTWYGYVSLPLFQFLLCRWYYRFVIWIRFLWQVSRIALTLVPTHPDRLGGLGFLSDTIYAFAPLAAAHGALLAGLLANRIFYLGATLPEFMYEIALVVIFMMCLILVPLLVFTPQLAWAKRLGVREYGTLAERYVRAFDAKWLRGGAPVDEPLIGNADIQSLADMSNSFEVVRSMRMVPVTRDAILQLAATIIAPIMPLALTMMTFKDLLKVMFGIFF